jgi:PIN domain nuclease of toxin-antitoxin system
LTDRHSALLLDTHVAIWLGQSNLPGKLTDVLAGADRLLVSPVSAWEIGLLSRPELPEDRRLDFSPDPLTWFERLIQPPIELAPFTPAIAVAASFLPGTIHWDPADRLLIATARQLALTLITADTAILDYAAQGHVRALPC